MKSRTCVLALGILAAISASASAHFTYLVPDGATKGKAVFSDELKPDTNGVAVDRIANTKLVLIADGKTTELTWTLDKTANCYTFEVPGTGTRTVVGTTNYGVIQRGESKPALLRYFAKAVYGDVPATGAVAGSVVPLEVVPMVEAGKLRFKATAGGKPLAKTEVTIAVPGEEKKKIVTTDDAGLTESFDKPGNYGVVLRQVETKSGEVDGKKYDEVRNYATLVVTLGK